MTAAQALEQLRAFAETEKESTRICKDREMYQFYDGYLAALDAVQRKCSLALPEPESPAERESHGRRIVAGILKELEDRKAAALPAPPPENEWRTAALLKERIRRAIRERLDACESPESIAADFNVPAAFVSSLAQWELFKDDPAPPPEKARRFPYGMNADDHAPTCDIRTSRDGWDADCTCGVLAASSDPSPAQPEKA